MKKINVIDLDKTLIPFDSFRHLVISEIKAFNFKITFFVLIRKLRLIKADRFKSLVIKTLKLNRNSTLNRKIIDLIIDSIDQNILEKIRQESDNNTINILCSASASNYVNGVAKKLNWEGYGSYFNKKEVFYHMYGANKLKFIKAKFPQTEYKYNFAISDSNSDLELLKKFDKYEKI